MRAGRKKGKERSKEKWVGVGQEERIVERIEGTKRRGRKTPNNPVPAFLHSSPVP